MLSPTADVRDPHPPASRAIAYASQVSRLSSRAQRSTEWCAADPGPKYPGIRKKGTAGVVGSRLSLRSAGMTTEETAPYAIALSQAGRGGAGGAARPMSFSASRLPLLALLR